MSPLAFLYISRCLQTSETFVSVFVLLSEKFALRQRHFSKLPSNFDKFSAERMKHWPLGQRSFFSRFQSTQEKFSSTSGWNSCFTVFILLASVTRERHRVCLGTVLLNCIFVLSILSWGFMHYINIDLCYF